MSQLVRKRNALGRTRNFKSKNRPIGRTTSNQVVILNEAGRFVPDEFRVRLRWIDTTLQRQHISSTSLNWHIRSSAYDPDPAVLTGAIPGFVELANMYSFYRVNAMESVLEVCNQETSAITVVTWPSNTGSNVNSLTPSDLLEYASNVKGNSAMCSSNVGQSRCRIRTVATGKSLVPGYFKTDLDYAASTSGNPAAMFYINYGILNHVGSFTFAVPVRNVVVYDVTFFRRNTLET